ncbi:MAG: hypothetical protein WCQ77_07025 [Planctomycetota bacterium]
MSKVIPFIGMIVSGLVAILFLADLAAGFPFQRIAILTDIGFFVSSGILAYLSWSIMDKPRR